MEGHPRFPTYNDIYSMFKTPYIMKLDKKRRMIKLLQNLLEVYPDLKKFVAENSLDNSQVHKLLKGLISKMIDMKKNPPSSSTEEFFHITFVPGLFPEVPIKDGPPILTQQQSYHEPNVLLVDKGNVDQIPEVLNQDDLPILTNHELCQERNPRTFCVANAWSGFPTFGSIYSTSKLERIQQQKYNAKEFILAIFEILMQKYPRLRNIFYELDNSHSVSTTLLYILNQADKLEESSCKQEKKRFFSTVYNLENISIISEYIKEKKNGKSDSYNNIENVPGVSDTNQNDIENVPVVSDTNQNDIENVPVALDMNQENIEIVGIVSNMNQNDNDIENVPLVLDTNQNDIENVPVALDINQKNIEIVGIVSKINQNDNDIENVPLVLDTNQNDIENVPVALDMDQNDMMELSENISINENSSSVCVDKKANSIDFNFDPESTESDVPHNKSKNNKEIKTYLSEYLETLKCKYAWTQSELAKKRNLEIDLEKKLKNLLMKETEYKCKIKRCRKEMSEIDTFKPNCRKQTRSQNK